MKAKTLKFMIYFLVWVARKSSSYNAGSILFLKFYSLFLFFFLLLILTPFFLLFSSFSPFFIVFRQSLKCILLEMLDDSTIDPIPITLSYLSDQYVASKAWTSPTLFWRIFTTNACCLNFACTWACITPILSLRNVGVVISQECCNGINPLLFVIAINWVPLLIEKPCIN